MKKLAYRLLVLASAMLIFASCGDKDPQVIPDPNNPETPVTPETLKLSFKQPTKILSLGEELPLSDLVVEADKKAFDAKTLKIESSDKAVAEVKDGFIKTTGAGETELTLTSGNETHTLSLAVQDFAQPFNCTPDFFQKYIWDYKADPKNVEIRTERPVVIDFWADWCGPCKIIAAPYKELAKDYKGKAILLKVDCSKRESPNWKIMSALYNSGHKELAKISNAKGEVALPTLVCLSARHVEEHEVHIGANLAPIKKFLEWQFK